MDVFWMEQQKSDLPPQDDWLSGGELACLGSMRFEKRRADWRLGRWTAKRSLAAYLHLPDHPQALAEIEVRPAPSGAPVVFLANEPADVTISLSHRAGIALCVVAASDVALGCDLEIVEPRSDAFVSDYFTLEEQELVAQTEAADRFHLLALLWSAKESALKALRIGLRIDTRSLVVNPSNAVRFQNQLDSQHQNNWHPLYVSVSGDQVFQGWWQSAHNVLRTLVAAPSPAPPVPLEISNHLGKATHGGA
jgi:4'-phosphopantetheinyl transferase